MKSNHPWRNRAIKEVFDKDKIQCGLKAKKLEKNYEYVESIHPYTSYYKAVEYKKDSRTGKYYKSYRKAESIGYRILMRVKEVGEAIWQQPYKIKAF